MATYTANTEASLVARWGDIILDAGHTSIPNLLLELYSELGISNQELIFIIHIFNYRWTKKNPYPAVPTIARKMNVTDRSVQFYIKKLKTLTYQTKREKEEGLPQIPFLLVQERYRTDSGQLSNLYDFSGLTAATVKLAIEKGLVTDTALRGATDTPGENNFTPPGEENFTPPVRTVSPKKEKSKKNQNNNTQSSINRTASAETQEKEGGSPNGTYSHIARTAIGKPLTQEDMDTRKRRKDAGHTSTNITNGLQQQLDLLQQRTQQITALPNGYTEAEDSIALYIEDFSRTLSDYQHTKANVSQAINLFNEIREEIPDMTIMHYLYILETFKDIVQYRRNVKNKMAYYFTCLRNCLWPQDQGFTPRGKR